MSDLNEVDLQQLDPRWIEASRRASLVTSAILAALLFGGAAVAVLVAYLPAVPIWTAAVILAVAITALGLWWPGVEYRHIAYRLTPRSLEIRRGVLWQRQIDVPRSRIQHTDVSQGPFERLYGLGTLSVYTAGTEHAHVPLPGLDHARALEIRANLMRSDDDDIV